MKDWLAGVGGVLLVLCGLLTVATIHTGGVRHVDSAGRTTEVLTWQGWQPADESSPPPVVAPAEPPVVAQAAPQVHPTAPPAPTPQQGAPPTSPVPTVLFTEPPVVAARPEQPPLAQQVIPRVSEPVPTAARGSLSPWDVLGWVLVGLCAVLGLVLVGYLVVLLGERIRRHWRRTAHQNAAVAGTASLENRMVPPEPTGEVAPTGDQDHTLPGDAVYGRPVELHKYLAGEA